MCELIFCLYMQASTGIQYSYIKEYSQGSSERSNDYDVNVGSFSTGIELSNGLFFEFEHTSGFNTNELDGGMNVVQFGYKLYLFGGK